MNSNNIVFNTKNNNYFYSQKNNQVLLLHPLMHYLLLLEKKGVNLNLWAKKIKQKIYIDSIGTFSKKELMYQYRKYLFFRENKYFDTKNLVLRQISGEDVKYSLANTRNLIFEVTEDCNLSCDYCVYGKYYVSRRVGQKNSLGIESAKKALDFVFLHYYSSLNSSHDKNIAIGFYGGEALLNFGFIDKMVKYVKSSQLIRKNDIEFRMTTNGVFLDKYISFLVEHNFYLRISLDGGTEENNSYRKFHNGKSVFQKIYKNVLEIKEKFPDYFNNNVEFASVLHSKNSYSEVSKFFSTKFNKKVIASDLATDSLNPKYIKDFWKMYKAKSDFVDHTEDDVKKQKTPSISFDSLVRFIQNYSGYVKPTYVDLLESNEEAGVFQTGTCLPFSRMVFISAQGKILPCERVGHQYELGTVDASTVNIDFDKIANMFNDYYTMVQPTCRRCIHQLKCEQCILQTNIISGKFNCDRFTKISDIELSRFFSTYISILEEKPEIYLSTIKHKFI